MPGLRRAKWLAQIMAAGDEQKTDEMMPWARCNLGSDYGG